MTAAMALRFQGKVSSRGEADAYLKIAGDAVLVERGRPRLLILACPCGCGENFPINLDPRAGPSWRLYHGSLSSKSVFASSRRNPDSISLFPSVWRDSGCRSHYIIWNGKIVLFGKYEDDFEATPQLTPSMLEAVYAKLPNSGLIQFAEIAESLESVPWDVLTACRELVKAKRAYEGGDKQRGSFGRK
ncbi:hypothetical protein GALL_375250 [mine drainage metagenome]|uniref:Uncharacterized protein n=1 Tax=mine drainage metagenome TaxID=410659 RepID=A0A1J5QLA3_9ZZZZ